MGRKGIGGKVNPQLAKKDARFKTVFVKELNAKLTDAVQTKSVCIKDVFNHFLKYAGDGGIVDEHAVSEGAKRLGLEPSQAGVAELFRYLGKGTGERLLPGDLERFVRNDINLLKREDSIFFPGSSQENIKIGRNVTGQKELGTCKGTPTKDKKSLQ